MAEQERRDTSSSIGVPSYKKPRMSDDPTTPTLPSVSTPSSHSVSVTSSSPMLSSMNMGGNMTTNMYQQQPIHSMYPHRMPTPYVVGGITTPMDSCLPLYSPRPPLPSRHYVPPNVPPMGYPRMMNSQYNHILHPQLGHSTFMSPHQATPNQVPDDQPMSLNPWQQVSDPILAFSKT